MFLDFSIYDFFISVYFIGTALKIFHFNIVYLRLILEIWLHELCYQDISNRNIKIHY